MTSYQEPQQVVCRSIGRLMISYQQPRREIVDGNIPLRVGSTYFSSVPTHTAGRGNQTSPGPEYKEGGRQPGLSAGNSSKPFSSVPTCTAGSGNQTSLGPECKEGVKQLGLSAGNSSKPFCFAMLNGDAMLKMSFFLPPVNTALVGPPISRIARLARARRNELNSTCKCFSKPFKMDLHGVEASLSSALKPLSEAVSNHWAFVANGPGGVSLDQVGIATFAGFNCTTVGTETERCPNRSGVRKPIQIPSSFAHLGLFWWISQLWAWLLQPSEALYAKLKAVRSSLNWEDQRPISGIHVRHGDSCIPAERLLKKGLASH